VPFIIYNANRNGLLRNVEADIVWHVPISVFVATGHRARIAALLDLQGRAAITACPQMTALPDLLSQISAEEEIGNVTVGCACDIR
jgi:hypothetical protein